MISGKCWVNNHAHILKPKSGLNIYYLLHSLNMIDLSMEVNGTTRQKLTQTAMRRIKLPLPPVELQNQFADFVQQVDKSKVIKESVKSRFIEMFENNPDSINWPIKTIEQVCEVVTDGSHYSPEDAGSGYPMLSVKDMGESNFDYSDCKYISQKDYDILVKNGCKPMLGDVLIAKDGSFFKKGFVIKEEKEQAILSSIAIMRPQKNLMNPEYLVKFLLSDKVLSSVSSMTSGTALKRVILKKFKSMNIPVPPIELQNEFVNYIQQVDKSKVGVLSTILLINIYINTEA